MYQSYTFCSCPTVFGFSVLFFQSLFCLLCGFWGFYWFIILSSVVSSVLLCPSKAFSFSVTPFLISSIYFWFFLRISISLFTLPVCPCMLYTLCIRALSILIIFIFNFWSHNSNIPATSCSGSNLLFVLWYVLWFYLEWTDIMCQVKGNVVNKPLMIWWWGVWMEGYVFYTLWLGLRLLVSLRLWTMRFTSISQCTPSS